MTREVFRKLIILLQLLRTFTFLSWDFCVLPLLFFAFSFTVVVLLTVNINIYKKKKKKKDCCSILANLKVASGLEKLSAMDIEVLAVTAWSLLINRNAVHHGDPGKQAATIVTESSRHMEEYCLAQAPSSPWPVHHPTSWSLPLPNIFKVNTGGAVLGQLDKGRCGIGVVIHNDKGQIMGALSKRIPYPLGAMEIEAKALDCLAIFPGSWDCMKSSWKAPLRWWFML